MATVGQCLKDGLFIDEVFHLVRGTDAVVNEWVVEHVKEKRQFFLSDFFWRLYVIQSSSTESIWPASVIVVQCHNDFRHKADVNVINKVVSLCERVHQCTPGELYLICLLLKWADSRAALRLPDLCEACWQTGIYNLQLEVLDLIRSFARNLGTPTREEVIKSISSLETKNIFLGSQLVETLDAYGLVESPINSEAVMQQIEELLATPDDSTAQERAHDIISSQFDEIVGPAYFEAVENLASDQKVRFLTMAALGTPDYAWFGDHALQELVKLDNPIALPAFLHRATKIVTDTPFVQDATSTFVIAQVGCARFLEQPPQLERIDSDDHRAWQAYGEIIFWNTKPGLTETEITSHCTPLWQQLCTSLTFEAVDPLMQLAHSHIQHMPGGSKNLLGQLYGRHKEPIRKILQFGLMHRSQLSTLFKHRNPYSEKGRTEFMIGRLGDIGDGDSIKDLEPLVDSPEYGSLAVKAIRKLKSLTP